MRLNLTKTLIGLLAIFGLYTLITTLIAVFGLKTTPIQLYKSTIVVPKVLELEKTNIDKLDLNSVRFISAFTQEGQSYLFVKNSDKFPANIHSSLEELLLQYASGSKDAFASHCPSRRYVDANCTGPIYDGTTLVQPRTCECVPI